MKASQRSRKKKRKNTPTSVPTAAIDLHGMTVFEAEEALFKFIDHQPKSVKCVEVTHGYNRGTRLKNMVRGSFHHWRVVEKRVGLNAGATDLMLK